MRIPALRSPSPVERGREARLFRLATALEIAFLLDDAFGHPEPGTTVGDHLVSGTAGVAVVAGRSRPSPERSTASPTRLSTGSPSRRTASAPLRRLRPGALAGNHDRQARTLPSRERELVRSRNGARHASISLRRVVPPGGGHLRGPSFAHGRGPVHSRRVRLPHSPLPGRFDVPCHLRFLQSS
jgi:hypothetical protein